MKFISKHKGFFLIILILLGIYLTRFATFPSLLNFPGPYIGCRSTGEYYDLYTGKENQNKNRIAFKDKDGNLIIGFIAPQTNKLKESYLDLVICKHNGYIILE